MRICFLNHNLNPATGAGRFGLNLVLYLQRADPAFNAVVLTTVSFGHPLERPLLPANWIRLLIALPEIRREFRRADIIHALDGYPYGIIAAFALIGIRRPLVITAIGTGAVQPLYRWYGGALAWAYRRAARVVAISNYTRREILARVPDVAVEVVNHAVDAAEFEGDLMGVLSEVEKSEIEKLRPYILSVGGWKRRKGFQYSFTAFAEVKKRFPGMHYAVCGIGPKPQLEKPFGLEGSVSYFKGIRWPFLKALYASAECFLLLPVDDAKDIEGFGFAFLEAAAAGLPVIGTRQSGAEDALLDGKNGFLVPQRDAGAAAEAAIRILSDAGLRGRFSAASRSFAGRMTWERVITSYLEIYRELA
ncbi:MAG: glycosyltransferase family 4 protein [bacterium]|nr:glycosyltransferase family 4 protein [bacterium]